MREEYDNRKHEDVYVERQTIPASNEEAGDSRKRGT